MRFREFIRNRARISIRTKGDAIFLSVLTVFGIMMTFVLTIVFTGISINDAFGGNPILRNWIIGSKAEPKPVYEVLGVNQLSVLIIGTDEYLEYDPGRSDTIIWAYVDFRNDRVDILSIPRDLMVWLPMKRPHFDKICHAYSFGGADLVKAAVEELLGVKTDLVVKIDYNGFRRIIDQIGGVRIYVDRNMKYDDRAGNLHIDLKEGMQVLDGKNALDYVRFRKDKKGDLGRIERQQKFMMALKDKAFNLSQIRNVDDIAKIIADSIKFEPSIDYQVVIPIIFFFNNIGNDAVHFHSVPIARDVVYNELAALAPYYSELDKLISGIIENSGTGPEVGVEEDATEIIEVPIPTDFEDE